MGSQISLNNTPLGQSLVGKKFKTVMPICFFFEGYDNQYGIKNWGDRSHLLNPKLNSFDLKINNNVKFEITNVIKTWSYFNGYMIRVGIKFLNNIDIHNISYVREAIINQFTFPTFNDKNNINDIVSNKLPKIINNKLQTKNLNGNLYSFDFNFEFKKLNNGDYDQLSPCNIKTDQFIQLN